MKKMFLFKFFLAVIALCTLTASAVAALPENIAAIAKAATAREFPDADGVLLYDDEVVRYDESGIAETRDVYYQKILTENGRRKHRSIPITFNRHYKSITLQKLVIYRKMQEIVLDPAKCVSEESDNRSLKNNICDPNDRILRVNLPDLQVGDVILFDFHSRDVARRMPGSWQEIAVLQSGDPILEYHYTVDAPEKLPLAKIELRNGIPGCVTTAEERRDGRILYRFTAKNVPQIFLESAMFGARWHAFQRFHLSTVKSWEEVSRWYAKLCQKHLEKTSPELIAKAAELTKKCTGDAEKAAALFRYVSQEIRYMGTIAEDTAPGYAPHDVAYTFEQRAGVCRDKAALLVAMLRAVDLKAHMVLIEAGDHLDPDVPLLCFNHAIVAWEKAPGEFELMDPTVENAQEMLPASDADSSYLVATEKGETLRTTPAPAPEKNAVFIETRAVIDNNEALAGHVVCRPKGIFEHAYRNKFQGMTANERLQYLQSRTDRLSNGIRIAELQVKPDDLTDMSRELVLEFNYTVPAILPESDCAEAFSLPRFADVLGFRQNLIGKIDLFQRRYPRELASALIEEQTVVKLPETLRFLTMPQKNSCNSRIADWESRWSADDAELRYRSRLALKTLCVEPKEYPLLKQLSEKLKRDRATLPVCHLVFDRISIPQLLAIYPGVDNLILSDDTRAKVLSPHAVHLKHTLKRKILTPGGVRNHSEIAFSYRPERESFKLSATIRLPDGSKKILAPENIHEVDDPVFAGAPRYKKGKKVIANLPGVVPGAIIEVTDERNVKDLPFLTMRHVFGGHSPMISGRFSLLCDAKIPLKLADPTRNVALSDTSSDGQRTIVCTANNHPQLIWQKSQPPLFFFDDSFQVSTGNLESYAGNVIAALQAQVDLAGAQVEAVAKELKLSEAFSDEEKLIRIRDWADRRIRLAGPALNELLPGEFFSPETTIRDGYGNSSDRAIVIAALCRKADLEYEFLLVSPYPGDLRTIRQLSHTPGLDFTRVLVRRKGSDYFLNDTTMYAQLGSTRSEGCVGLTERGRLITIMPKVRCESGSHRKITAQIKPSGAAQISVETIFYGNQYEETKAALAKMTPELKRRYFEKLTLAFSPSAKAVDAPKADFDRYPGSIIYTFEQPDFGVRNGRFLTFGLPGYSELAQKLDVGSDRVTPYLAARRDLRLEYELDFPKEFTPTTKADGRRELGTSGIISYLARSSSMPGKITISHQLFMPRAILRTADAAIVELIHKKINHPHEWRIVLEKKEE